MTYRKKPKTGAVILFFIIATAILYYIYQKQLVPMPLLIFGIFFALIISISIYMLLSSEPKEFRVIPIKRRR
jgi:hypothetical protein